MSVLSPVRLYRVDLERGVLRQSVNESRVSIGAHVVKIANPEGAW